MPHYASDYGYSIDGQLPAATPATHHPLDCDAIKRLCRVVIADVDGGSTDELTLNAATRVVEMIASWQRDAPCRVEITSD